MKHIMILIALIGGAYAQTFTVDPNSITESGGFVTVDIRMTITAEQYEAMQYKNLTFTQVFERVRILRYFRQLVADVKRIIVDQISLTELKTLEK